MKVGDRVIIVESRSLKDTCYKKYIGHIGIVYRISDIRDPYPYIVKFETLNPVSFGINEIELHIESYYYDEV